MKYLTKLLNWFKGLFKTTSKEVATSGPDFGPIAPDTPQTPPKPDPKTTNGLDFATLTPEAWSYQQVTIRVGRTLTPEEDAYLAYKGITPEGTAPPAPVDPSAPVFGPWDVSKSSGVNQKTLQDGVPVTYNILEPGKVRVFGVSGSELTEVNGVKQIGGVDFPNTPAGPFTVVVQSSDTSGQPNVGVQLQ